MLETTSYAILPSTSKEAQKTFHHAHTIQSFKWNGRQLKGSLSKGNFLIYFIDSTTLRVLVNPFHEVEASPSIAAVGDTMGILTTLTETEETLVLHSQTHDVIISKASFSITIQAEDTTVFQTIDPAISFTHKKEVRFTLKNHPKTAIYGLGEKTGFLNKNGSKISNWNTDVYQPHNKDTVELYQSIPFAIMHTERETTGIFFDNSFRTEFDMQTNPNQMTLTADGGQVNVYLLLESNPKDVVSSYTRLTGKTPLPPKWALGYHQSRYSYSSRAEVTHVVDTFKKEKIPLDCLFLDIHYMDGYRVFTFDEENFPDYECLISKLTQENIDVVPIVDPGVKKDVSYPVYQEGIQKNYFCKFLEGEVYYGEVWPGVSAFPDFFQQKVQTWWGDLHQFYTDLGVRGIWNDMNEPSIFNDAKTMDLDVLHQLENKTITHKEGHNLYGLYMSKATFEGLKTQLQARPFSLTRAGYAGVQRYSAVWTGDNRSHWEHLEMSLPMIMNLGLSGVAFSGADVGGFSSDTTPELLIRWTQVGAFLPYFRNHSVQDSIRQEPWVFGIEVLTSVKKAIEWRYRFLPYLYTVFYEAEKTGLPVVRPLVLEYPKDVETFHCSDEFLLGSHVLVAPILRPNQRYRSLYLPEGTWFDYWSEEVYEGNKYHLIHADIHKLPIFIKSGTVLPLGTPVQNTKEIQHIELVAYYDEKKTMTGYLYEDDGYTYDYQQGQYGLRTFTLLEDGDGYHLHEEKEGCYPNQSKIQKITLVGTHKRASL